jgi:CHAT domain-containing protein/uncharacterized protein HemY
VSAHQCVGCDSAKSEAINLKQFRLPFKGFCVAMAMIKKSEGETVSLIGSDRRAPGCRQPQGAPVTQVFYRCSVKFIGQFLFFILLIFPLSQRASVFAEDLNQQSIQQSRDSGDERSDERNDETSDEKDLRILEPGKPIERELAGGQHSYRIRLRTDQYLGVIVEQKGVDLVVAVTGPDGKQMAEFDSESLPWGQERVSCVADEEGDYQLSIELRQRGALSGRYLIRIEELRAATENDRALQKAYALCEECRKLRVMGPPIEARPSIERALEIRERLLGPDHRDVAVALNGLGRIYRGRGDFAKAESLLHRSLAILERDFGPDHPAITSALNNLGHLYRNLADYAKAEALFQRALNILDKSLGPEHPDYAFTIHNLGLLYWSKGAYAKAEPLFHQALTIWVKALKPDDPDLGLANNGLGNFYRYRGDYPQAETFYRKALAIREKALGPEHPDLALTLNSLAILYRERGDYDEAEPLAQRALAIQEKVLGPDHSDVARTSNNLALLSYSRGDHQRAELLAQRALVIWEKAPGPEQFELAYTLNILARINRDRADYAKAEQLFQRSLGVLEKTLGPKHPYVADVLNDNAVLHMRMGNIAQAVAVQSRANSIGEQNLALNLVIGSERQKLAFLSTLSKEADRTLSLHLRYAPNDPAARNQGAAIILQRKGRALDATSQSLGALRERSDPKDQALLDQLSDTRSQIASLVLGEPQRITVDQYFERIGRLEAQAEELEVDIGRRSSEFRAQSLPVTLAAVQSAIPADSVLVEFASYRPFDAHAKTDDMAYGEPHYAVYVLRRNGEIQWKELGAAKAIDRAVAALREALRDPRRTDVRRLARSVDQKVFQPIRPLVGNLTRLLISPDGMLNLLPFAALVDERGRFLVERYSISYLASGRDLLRLQVARESSSGPLVIADPDFGSRSRGGEVHRPQQKTVMSKGENRVKESAASAFGQFYFSPLPYTAREGDALQSLLPDATLLTGREASKSALIKVRSPILLHIATHGFFLDDLQLMASVQSGVRSVSNESDHRLRMIEANDIHIENPLLRSGVALAGANEHKADDNGILTALEMTGLNLWGTKLVVLSGCDTGMGEVKSGDGVHGLRRALVLAGAEAQVMSLWAVSDKGTRELMVSYYKKLTQGQGRGGALRQVQLEMLKQANREHPYYWASFIQSGEWANLEDEQIR